MNYDQTRRCNEPLQNSVETHNFLDTDMVFLREIICGKVDVLETMFY